MSNYYSDSLLSAYLESTETLPESREPETTPVVPIWKVDAPNTSNLFPTCESDTTNPISYDPNTRVHSISGHRKSSLGTMADSTPATGNSTPALEEFNFSDPTDTYTCDALTQAASMNRASVHSSASRLSVSSAHSGEMSLLLSLDSLSDLQSVAPARTKSRVRRFRNLFGSDNGSGSDDAATDGVDSTAVACARIEGYFAEPGAVPWTEIAETFFFGDTLDVLFPANDLAAYVCHSAHELGELRFSNLALFHAPLVPDPVTLLRAVAPRMAAFDSVLDLYASDRANRQLPQLFEMLSAHATHSEGLCIPLAVAMFGNWLLDYNRDPEGASNYKNGLILHYFRKAARMALAFRRLAPWLEPAVAHIAGEDRVTMSRFLHRDMDNALALALSSLAAYYQYAHNHTVAVSLWELNCHLTQDAESGHLAILGLGDGFGLGNRIKERRLGKRARANKFATKRRIAHLYRILMQLPDFDEYGASWATKEKYD